MKLLVHIEDTELLQPVDCRHIGRVASAELERRAEHIAIVGSECHAPNRYGIFRNSEGATDAYEVVVI